MKYFTPRIRSTPAFNDVRRILCTALKAGVDLLQRVTELQSGFRQTCTIEFRFRIFGHRDRNSRWGSNTSQERMLDFVHRSSVLDRSACSQYQPIRCSAWFQYQPIRFSSDSKTIWMYAALEWFQIGLETKVVELFDFQAIYMHLNVSSFGWWRLQRSLRLNIHHPKLHTSRCILNRLRIKLVEKVSFKPDFKPFQWLNSDLQLKLCIYNLVFWSLKLNSAHPRGIHSFQVLSWDRCQ